MTEEEFKKWLGEESNKISKTLYILDENKNPINCTVIQYGEFMEDGKRKRIKRDEINEYLISTVFLGIVHGYALIDKKPILFETMVFGDSYHEIYCDRYPTWDESIKGHERAVQWVKDGCKEEDHKDNQ